MEQHENIVQPKLSCSQRDPQTEKRERPALFAGDNKFSWGPMGPFPGSDPGQRKSGKYYAYHLKKFPLSIFYSAQFTDLAFTMYAGYQIQKYIESKISRTHSLNHIYAFYNRLDKFQKSLRYIGNRGDVVIPASRDPTSVSRTLWLFLVSLSSCNLATYDGETPETDLITSWT